MVTLYDIDMFGRMVSHPDGDWVRRDDYAALEARIAELESRLEIDTEHDIDGIGARNATIELQYSVINELKSRIAALKKDAARYRWLRQHFRFANDSMHEVWFDALLEPNDSGVPTDLDQTIDAAMQTASHGAGVAHD